MLPIWLDLMIQRVEGNRVWAMHIGDRISETIKNSGGLLSEHNGCFELFLTADRDTLRDLEAAIGAVLCCEVAVNRGRSRDMLARQYLRIKQVRRPMPPVA